MKVSARRSGKRENHSIGLKMAQPKKGAPDWERIEADYRAGVLSIREIAKTHEITDTAIRKHATREGWERDLAKRIQAKAEALVRTAEVRTQVRTQNKVSDRELVDANAERIADVQLTQRKDIARSRRLAMTLLAELESVTGSIDLFQQLGEMLRSPDDRGADKLNDLYLKVISMSGRVGNMKQLSDALKTLIGLEREAYGLKTGEAAGDSEPAKEHFNDAELLARARRIVSGRAQRPDAASTSGVQEQPD